MATLRITVPDGTTNYVQNPSCRYDTTGWVVDGSTLTRVLTRARFGIASMQVVTNGSALREGIYYRVSSLSGISDTITVSAYVRGSGMVRIRLIDNPTGNEWVSERLTLSSDRWHRIYVTGRCTGSNDLRLYIETDGDRAQAVTFYVDGAQMERKPYPTTYVDGDQPGCRWNIVSHGSISSRDPYSRAGGRWIELAGPARVDEDLYITVIGGLGMPPTTNIVQSYAVAPGAYSQGTKVEDRVATITFHAKRERKTNNCSAVSLEHLHNLRRQLTDAVKPDRTGGGEEFLLEYQDGDFPMYLRARYDGGLEGDWDVRNQWINSFPVRFLSVFPYMNEDSKDVAALNFTHDLGVLNNVAARMDGAWSNMNYGLNSTVRGMVIGPDGKVYAFGDFLFANNDASAVSPTIPAGGIAWWNGTEWAALGTGAISGGGYITSAAIAPNGYIYVTGSFTSIGGVAANYVAYWNGSAWNAMGTGLNAAGNAVAVAPNGDVYVGGAFTTAGGNNAYRVARYDGSWHNLGPYGGLNATVQCLAISRDGGEIYIGGQFTDEYSDPLTTLNYVCEYTVSSNEFGAMSTDGMNGIVYALALAMDGRVYATGAFTTAGGATVNYVAAWIGSTWTVLGSGLNGNGLGVSVAPDGTVLCAGAFTTAGGNEAYYVARWDGSVWVPLDIHVSPTGSANVYAAVQSGSGDIFLGGSSFATGSKRTKTSAITYVDNIGSAETNPEMYLIGPGHLRWLENRSTGKVVRFSLDLLNDEEVFLDFAKGQIRSTVRGDLSQYILPGSDFRDFTLLPGQNKIAAFMPNDVDAYMQVGYVVRHWGVDFTANGEDF